MREKAREAMVPFKTQSRVLISSTFICEKKVSNSNLYSRGEEMGREEHQRICEWSFKLQYPKTVSGCTTDEFPQRVVSVVTWWEKHGLSAKL